jgi:hypothetical protein
MASSGGGCVAPRCRQPGAGTTGGSRPSRDSARSAVSFSTPAPRPSVAMRSGRGSPAREGRAGHRVIVRSSRARSRSDPGAEDLERQPQHAEDPAERRAREGRAVGRVRRDDARKRPCRRPADRSARAAFWVKVTAREARGDADPAEHRDRAEAIARRDGGQRHAGGRRQPARIKPDGQREPRRSRAGAARSARRRRSASPR